MTYPTMQQVAGYIDDARKGQGLSYKDLATLTGFSPRSVSAKLAGERPIRTGDLYRFAVALGTTPGQIYTQLG